MSGLIRLLLLLLLSPSLSYIFPTNFGSSFTQSVKSTGTSPFIGETPSASAPREPMGFQFSPPSRTSPTMMPIGVPKVAYRVPGAQSADWVDIYNRLYRERIIFVAQEVEDEIANQIIGVLLYLDSEDR